MRLYVYCLCVWEVYAQVRWLSSFCCLSQSASTAMLESAVPLRSEMTTGKQCTRKLEHTLPLQRATFRPSVLNRSATVRDARVAHCFLAVDCGALLPSACCAPAWSSCACVTVRHNHLQHTLHKGP